MPFIDFSPKIKINPFAESFLLSLPIYYYRLFSSLYIFFAQKSGKSVKFIFFCLIIYRRVDKCSRITRRCLLNNLFGSITLFQLSHNYGNFGKYLSNENSTPKQNSSLFIIYGDSFIICSINII